MKCHINSVTTDPSAYWQRLWVQDKVTENGKHKKNPSDLQDPPVTDRVHIVGLNWTSNKQREQNNHSTAGGDAGLQHSCFLLELGTLLVEEGAYFTLSSYSELLVESFLPPGLLVWIEVALPAAFTAVSVVFSSADASLGNGLHWDAWIYMSLSAMRVAVGVVSSGLPPMLSPEVLYHHPISMLDVVEYAREEPLAPLGT